MTTRAKAGIFKSKALTSTSSTNWALTEPSRLKDAIATPSWKRAMDEEYTALLKKQDMVSCSPFSKHECGWQ